MAARVLKPRKDVWRADAARMARGPKRAPGLYVTAVSKGTPRIAMSKMVSGLTRHLTCSRCAKELTPENGHFQNN
jgi:hypothetical protein